MRRGIGRTGAFIACILVVSSSATAQERALDMVQPVLTRAEYSRLSQSLGLDRDQRLIADLFHKDYADAAALLLERTDAAAEAAGRSTVESALRATVYLEPDELRALRRDVQLVYQKAFPTADELLDGLLENMRVQLTPQQAAKFDVEMRRVRRAVWLHPRRAGQTDYDYAGDGLDVIQLVEQARQAGGRLEDAPQTQVNAILDDYAQALDALLQSDARDDRDGRMSLRIAQIERGESAIREARKAQLERWGRLHELNDETARRIATALDKAGQADAAVQWIDMVEQAIFPWLYQPSVPDHQRAWFEQENLPDDTATAISIHDAYDQKRRALRRQASAIMLQVRLQLHVLVHPMLDRNAVDNAASRQYEQLVRISGELSGLGQDTAAAMVDLLDDDQRRDLDHFLGRRRR